MRDLALRGGPWSDAERLALLRYCETDVVALAKLLPPMLRHIDLPRALLRGRYMAAAAEIEHAGAPIDVPLLDKLREKWGGIQDQLIADIDSGFGVYDGRTFKADRFAAWLAKADIPWPRLDSGKLELGDDIFRQMAKAHPAVLIAAPLELLDEHVAGTQEAMREASAATLAGFELGTDVKTVRYPDRYADPRGAVMWGRVMRLIGEAGDDSAWGAVSRQRG
jgi:hypothetical protein